MTPIVDQTPLTLTATECQRLSEGGLVIRGELQSAATVALRPGAHIRLVGCDVDVRVKSVRSYANFRQLVLNEGLRNVNPQARSLAEAIDAFKGSLSHEQVQAVGVVAIALERARA